ncbi:hypothetical protein Mal64_15100 [Pseudobythopirellula maris]|uniref:Uncharacterized protein n=1 Tax=Pseudobythopirellula maris TaxID=2527991 RepID=A0A5C5ZVW6_9BACT|nr:hypothetical protein [Pseudobythopirellula maris]TWT91111.1 hypothetical protein Mal64_15100 [Pseudobythopirellula maris]
MQLLARIILVLAFAAAAPASLFAQQDAEAHEARGGKAGTARVVSDGALLATDWVLTADGWLRLGEVTRQPTERWRPALHPGVVAVLLGLSSVLALGCFPSQRA